MFCDVFSFPPGVYVGAFILIASIPGPFILTFHIYKVIAAWNLKNRFGKLPVSILILWSA